MSKVSKDTKKSKNKEKNIKDNKIGVKDSKKELEKVNNELIKDKENYSTIKLDQTAGEESNPKEMEDQLIIVMIIYQ